LNSEKEPLDFLIVGQGLAGTLLAHFLLKEKQRIAVIDQPLEGATSRIAAGIVNPITGRRLVKSWRFEEIYPFAKETYLALEKQIGISIWHERNIVRALPTVFDENEWLRRPAFEDYRSFIAGGLVTHLYPGSLRPVRAWGESRFSVQVAMPQLVSSFRNYLLRDGMLREEIFDYPALKIQKGEVFYRGLNARQVVFCEGSRAAQNPFFDYLPFAVTKGELLLIKIPGVKIEKIVKHRVFIVPLEGDLYWVGSTSRYEFEHRRPEQEKRQWLESQLKELLKVPFEVVEHLVGIRPTVFQHRPFLGTHPEYRAVSIFNGLGTKGASLGPFFAHQMAGFLLGKNTLDGEVDICRFPKTRK
jgi:glycine oxidase